MPLPAPWRREIALFSKLAIPMVATTLLQFSLNLVDTAVVGSFSTLELAGLAAGNSVYFFAFVVLQGLYYSLDMVFGELFGKKNLQGAVTALHAAIGSGLGLSIIMAILVAIAAYFFEIFGSTPDIVAVTKPYLYVVAATIPPSLILVQLQKFNQVFGNAMAIVWLTVGVNIVNLILDIVLVFGIDGMIPAMGSLGAGYATLGCRLLAIAVAFGISFGFGEKLARSWQITLDHSLASYGKLRSEAMRMLKMGFPIALQLAAEIFMFSAATILATSFGDVLAAAHQIVLQVCSATFMIPLAIGSSTSMRVSTVLGSADAETSDAIRSGWIGIAMATVPMAITGVLLYMFPKLLLSPFSNDTAVIASAASILFLGALFQVFDGMQVGAAGALRGIGKVNRPLYGNLIGHYLVGLPLGVYTAYGLDLKVYGIWLGLAAGLAAVAVYNTTYWRRDSKAMLA